jgi:hypothetical protein
MVTAQNIRIAIRVRIPHYLTAGVGQYMVVEKKTETVVLARLSGQLGAALHRTAAT